jgi:hypothetical protein
MEKLKEICLKYENSRYKPIFNGALLLGGALGVKKAYESAQDLIIQSAASGLENIAQIGYIPASPNVDNELLTLGAIGTVCAVTAVYNACKLPQNLYQTIKE